MNLAILLSAIAVVESNNNDYAIGRAHEISRYQILPRVWRHYTPSTSYASHAIATRVALRHITHILGRLPARAQNVRGVAVAWNYGLTRFKLVHYNWTACPQPVIDYANRIHATYIALESRVSAATTVRASVVGRTAAAVY